MLDRLQHVYAKYSDEVNILHLPGTMDSRAVRLRLAPKKQKRVAVLHEYDEAALMSYLGQLQHDQMQRMAGGKQPLRICIVLVGARNRRAAGDDAERRAGTGALRVTTGPVVALVMSMPVQPAAR